ncbi:MAG: hypothetical protein ACTSPQ_19185 [Candidatus Helarchaeota archaeon]
MEIKLDTKTKVLGFIYLGVIILALFFNLFPIGYISGHYTLYYLLLCQTFGGFFYLIGTLLLIPSFILFLMFIISPENINYFKIGRGLDFAGWVDKKILSISKELKVEQLEAKKIEPIRRPEPKLTAQRAQLSTKIAKEIKTQVKYPESGAESLLDKMRDKFNNNLNTLKKLECVDSDSYNLCKGEAVYICHHCGKTLCYVHSFWIPDLEFPKFSKKREEKIIINKLYMTIFIIALCASIGLFITFLILTFIFINFLIFLIISSASIFLSFIFYGLAIKKIPFFYTHYVIAPTRWDFVEKDGWTHVGFYLAVHCWDCLKKYHNDFISESISLMNSLQNTNWFKRHMELHYHSPSDIAEIYLEFFKWGESKGSSVYFSWIPLTNNKGIKIYRDNNSTLFWNVIYNSQGELTLIDKNQKISQMKIIYESNLTKQYYWKRKNIF